MRQRNRSIRLDMLLLTSSLDGDKDSRLGGSYKSHRVFNLDSPNISIA
jgi:hypothetical protein